MTDSIFPSWSAKNIDYFILDALFNAFLVTPLSVALWWSVWDLFDALASTMHRPDTYPNLGYWILLASGTLGEMILYLLQFKLRPYLSADRQSKTFIAIATRIEMYVMFMLTMSVWVSGWKLLDALTGVNAVSTFTCLAISEPVLIILRSCNNCVSIPMQLKLDSRQTLCNFPTRFNVNPHRCEDHRTRQWFMYLLDCIVTVIVINYLIIAYWRGAFNVLNLYFLPDQHKLSNWITIAIGYAMFALLLLLQFPAVRVARSISSPWLRSPWEIFYWLMAFLMMVCIWRGEWNAIIFYSGVGDLAKPYRYIALLVAHVVLVVVMMALDIFVNGMQGFTEVDGALANGNGLLIRNYFGTVSVS